MPELHTYLKYWQRNAVLLYLVLIDKILGSIRLILAPMDNSEIFSYQDINNIQMCSILGVTQNSMWTYMENK